MYGAGRFGYSINDATSATQTLGTAGTNKFVTSSVSLADVNYDTQFTSSNGADIVSGLIYKIAVPTASISGYDDKGIRGFRVEGAEITDQYPQFTVANGGDIVFVAKGALDASTLVVKYHKQPTDTSRGDFEATGTSLTNNPEVDIDIPELNVEMKSLPIVAKTRKLKAQWTPEFAQDLNAYHSIDAEAELTSMLSEYISQEIDFEILDMLISGAKSVGYWSTQVGREWNGSAFADYSTYRYMGLTDGSSDNRVIILYYNSSTRIRVLLSSGGTKYFDSSYPVTSIEDFHKVALKWKENDFALWIDGVERATDTSGLAPIGLNTVALDQAGGDNFYGKVKQLQVYDTALTDEQLLQLTGESGTDFYESYAEMASALTYTIQ